MGILTVFLSIKGLINKAGRGSWDTVSNPNMMALTIRNRKGQFKLQTPPINSAVTRRLLVHVVALRISHSPFLLLSL
jgi:hypothetical protein